MSSAIELGKRKKPRFLPTIPKFKSMCASEGPLGSPTNKDCGLDRLVDAFPVLDWGFRVDPLGEQCD